MISKDMIRKGIESGCVQFVYATGECGCLGIACKIGDLEFYFDEDAAEEKSVAEYLLNQNMDSAIDKVFDALYAIHEGAKEYGFEGFSEYEYYEDLLNRAYKETDSTEFRVRGLRDPNEKPILNPKNAIDRMETLGERDKLLEEAWSLFGDIPMDPETEKMEEAFACFPAGTDREDIWHWFDQRHSKGVAYLLYKDGIDRSEGIEKLAYLNTLCSECESVSCQFNHAGKCRFALVHERKPRINDEDGCIDFDYRDEEGEEKYE